MPTAKLEADDSRSTRQAKESEMTVIPADGRDDDIIEGQIVGDADSDAYKRAAEIRRGIDAWTDVLSLIIEAYKEKDWETLGYSGWTEYVNGEFETNLLKLNAKVRKEWAPQLKAAGMSTREIAPVMNVDQSTVVRDAKSSDGPASPGDALKKAMKRVKAALAKVRDEMANVDPEQEWVKSDIREIADLVKDIRKPKTATDESADSASTDEPTAKQVNDWLKSEGKESEVTRGAVSKALKQEYIKAHKS